MTPEETATLSRLNALLEEVNKEPLMVRIEVDNLKTIS